MNLRPNPDLILVKKLPRATESAGGIIIPETAADQPGGFPATVIAVGLGRLLKDGSRAPADNAPGETVIVGKYAGHKVTLDGEELLMLKQDEILGVVEGEQS
jgi:chaperonin GroES